MFAFTQLHLSLHDRAVLVRNGAAVRALGPGRHSLWKDYEIYRYDTRQLVFNAPAIVLAAMPAGWVEHVVLGPTQRAIVERDGVPVEYLRPGVHRVWTVDPTVVIRAFDVTGELPVVTDDLRELIPTSELVDVVVRHYERGLKYVNGRFEEVLEAGHYVFWNHAAAHVSVTVVDTRVQQLKIEGQELMTRDKVTLRLTLTAEYAPADAPTTVHAVADAKDALYLAVQLAAREKIATMTLDELLEGRDTVTGYVEAQVVPRAAMFGVRVQRIGIKDVILPGDMKTLLNKVIEAEKVAAANVILRREDAAATRNLANTAKVIAENPVLMRLKELETMKDVAAHIDELKLVVGGDSLAGLVTAATRP